MEIKVLLLRARLKPVAQLQIALFTFSLLLTFFLILYPRDYFFFQENNSDLKKFMHYSESLFDYSPFPFGY